MLERVTDLDWSTWQPDDRATLLFVVHADRILLIEKKRGLGAGKINGPGGRIEPGESPRQAAVREVQEEVGVTPEGGMYKIARNALSHSEFAGACFSPDGSTLFVNMQSAGKTFAITGPWREIRGNNS